MPTGCTINRVPAVDAGGGAVGISDTRSSASATAAEDRSISRDNGKPIFGCYCDAILCLENSLNPIWQPRNPAMELRGCFLVILFVVFIFVKRWVEYEYRFSY